jgi:hypothetical protein
VHARVVEKVLNVYLPSKPTQFLPDQKDYLGESELSKGQKKASKADTTPYIYE